MQKTKLLVVALGALFEKPAWKHYKGIVMISLSHKRVHTTVG